VTSDAVLDRPVERPVAAVARGFFRPGWPLRVAFCAFPVWWLLGTGGLIFLAASVPLGWTLVRRGRITTPRGFGIWLLFLATVVLSLFVLWDTAPGTVPVTGTVSRLFVPGYRVLWYVAMTVVLLYIGNTSEDELPTRDLTRWLAIYFGVVVAGGLLGVVDPHFQFRSLTERILPARIAHNAFIYPEVHPQAAQIQGFLGYSEGRPSAPFFYTNSWGANLSLALPFFIIAIRDRRRWLFGVGVLALGIVPTIYSLNRALWIGLIVSAVFVVTKLAITGHRWAVRGAIVGIIGGIVLFFGSPLHSIVNERLQHGHSNARRGALASTTFNTVAHNSPIIGYGGTRRVTGNFTSISGGATPDCPVCAAPPLGTQGHLWLLLMGEGLVGTALFLAFFASQLGRNWRRTTPYAVAGCVAILVTFVELPFYDLLGPPLFILMLAVGLMWRAERAAASR
jgi:hypothetical protein